MKATNLELTKNELGILTMALDALFVLERREDHTKEYWTTFDDLQFKIIESRERIAE